MASSRSVRDLSGAEWRTLLVALPLLLGVRIALLFLPFQLLLERVNAVRPPGGAPVDPGRVERRIWAVRAVASRLFPRRPCLPQALAALLVLRSAGRPAHLRIGVRTVRGDAIEAHAWVESEGSIVVGGATAPRRYASLEGYPMSASRR